MRLNNGPQIQIAATNAVIQIITATSLLLCGCVSEQTSARRQQLHDCSLSHADDSPATLDVRFGRPCKVVDTAGWIVGTPRKLLLWDRRVDNHCVGDETTQFIAAFAAAHELDGLCVRVNQYDPLGEFRRLRTNQTVAPGWRYTCGTLSVIGYTLIPGRVFGSDQYNPYTDSVYVYSDVPALAVEATAYAKDVRSRSMPGIYAAVNELPFVSIWHESVNVRDAVAFVEQNGTPPQQVDGLRVLHANYGSNVAVATGAGPFVQIGAAVAGQFTGRFQAAQLQRDYEDSTDLGSDESDDRPVKLASATELVER